MSGARRNKRRRRDQIDAQNAAIEPARAAADEPPRHPVDLRSSDRIGWWFAGVITAAFAAVYTVPWRPAAQGPIGAFDFSWMQLLHEAVATGRQFGREII